MLKLAEKSIFKVEHFLTAIFFKNDSRYAIVQWYEMELLIGHTHILFYFIFGRIFRIFFICQPELFLDCVFLSILIRHPTQRGPPPQTTMLVRAS